MALRPRIVVCAAAVIALSLAACREKEPARKAVQPPPPSQTAAAAAPAPVPAGTVAYAGHGKLFDKNMKEIPSDPATLAAIQETMLREVAKEADVQKLAGSDPSVAKATQLLEAKKLPPEQSLALKAGIIEKALQSAPTKVRDTYTWRNRAVLSHYVNLHQSVLKTISPEVLQLLRDLGIFRPALTTGYIADCRAHDVPIPPDWAESGTPWVMQGTLTQNLLDPGGFAAVWTYSDPAKRGACIALPRGDGSPGSAAGIICQSATTGHACFWDNKLRSVDPERFIGWRGLRIHIADLKDGSNLDSPCTGCHTGNNVYLISPDDPTWVKVLRGPLSGRRTGTFTSRVEASSDMRNGCCPRYIPITTTPPRPGWENTLPTRGCSDACHEPPNAPVTPPPMPPACASGIDLSRCYGTP
jgi:hypothetical protein